MGSSIAQGGSGYPFFAPCIFSYIAGEDLGDMKVAREEIPIFDVASALERVRMYVHVMRLMGTCKYIFIVYR